MSRDNRRLVLTGLLAIVLLCLSRIGHDRVWLAASSFSGMLVAFYVIATIAYRRLLQRKIATKSARQR